MTTNTENWPHKVIDIPAGSPESKATDDTEAAGVVLEADPQRRRAAVILQVPANHTHAVHIAFGTRAATERVVARQLVPGATFDTSSIPDDRQPRGRITAWSGPSVVLKLNEDGSRAPGHVLLNVIEILA